MKTAELLAELRVQPGRPAELGKRDPRDRLGLGDRQDASARLKQLVAELSLLSNRLWAEARRSLLLVLQGLDASGKDSTISHVFTGVNPQGCRVHSFKEPAGVEVAHDYLGRIHGACPERGELGIFNRPYYEDVVTVRVKELTPEPVWRPELHRLRVS